MSYIHNKAWRLHNPNKRYEGKQRYYEKHREHPENRRNAGQEWTLSEMALITAPERPVDSVLAKKLGRSVEAIQLKRSSMKKSRGVQAK